MPVWVQLGSETSGLVSSAVFVVLPDTFTSHPNNPAMADSTPISPPTDSAFNEPPISPISRQTTFPHKTSASVSTRTPFIDTSTPAINDAPVELDGLPASPDALRRRQTDEEALNRARKGSVVSPGLGEEEEIEAEFLGEGGVRASKEIQQVRPALCAQCAQKAREADTN